MLEGADKKNSYDKFWLDSDMENLGYLFEYCPKYAKELYNTDNLDRVSFISAFMTSRFRRLMEEGHPRFLSQAAVDSFEMYVNVDFAGDYPSVLLMKLFLMHLISGSGLAKCMPIFITWQTCTVQIF